ncbi:MAG: sensor histidine kinase [Clostridia bacterium]|nr:sensor histidine kinase [Clostridia bacterium]MBO5300121.1 sensor histidine kinase [Clostridia bacterium]
MRELSLHILDIVQNSITAGAETITVEISEDLSANELKITIADNGCGMDEETLARVNGSFASSRTTRKIGMGIALFRAAAELSDGYLTLTSKKGEGTTTTAVFRHDSIDRMPLGDISGTMMLLAAKAHNFDLIYRHIWCGSEFVFSTKDIKEILEGSPIDSPEVLQYIQDYIHENLNELFGGERDEIS